jgi:predicted DNA-binding transcriptional regulator AlpA
MQGCRTLAVHVLGIEPDMRQACPGQYPEPLLLTAYDAASLCGTSLRTWRVWNSAGRIPRAVRIGRSHLWRLEELHAWVQAGCPRRDAWEGMYRDQRRRTTAPLTRTRASIRGVALQSTDVERHCHTLAGSPGKGEETLRKG